MTIARRNGWIFMRSTKNSAEHPEEAYGDRWSSASVYSFQLREIWHFDYGSCILYKLLVNLPHRTANHDGEACNWQTRSLFFLLTSMCGRILHKRSRQNCKKAAIENSPSPRSCIDRLPLVSKFEFPFYREKNAIRKRPFESVFRDFYAFLRLLQQRNKPIAVEMSKVYSMGTYFD